MASYIFLLAFLLFSVATTENAHLHTVFTLVNAGTISPRIPIPTMNWEDWDERGPKVLTSMGMREQYLLGRELRRRYESEKLLNETLLIDQIFVRMIDCNNTIGSGTAFLRGFLNENKDQLSAAELAKALPPIFVNEYFRRNIGGNVLPLGIATLPYHTHYPRHEDIFAPLFCPKAKNLTKHELIKNPAVKEIVEKYHEPFLALIAKHYKAKIESIKFPKDLPWLWSVLSAIMQFKETSLSHEEIELVNDYANSIYFYSKAISKVANSYRASPVLQFTQKFFKEVLTNLRDQPDRLENVKAGFVFGEERVMTSLLARLGYNVTTTMPSTSIITFEVRGPESFKELSELTITMKYNDEVIPISGCEQTWCTYVEFTDLVQKLVIKDVESLCHEVTH